MEVAKGAVVGILVMSDTTQVFGLRDDNRKILLVVEELTVEEARSYFDKAEVLQDAEGLKLRERIFGEDTTLVGALEAYAELWENTPGDAEAKRAAAKGRMERRAVEAESAVDNLLDCCVNTEGISKYLFRRLMLQLLEDDFGHAVGKIRGLTVASEVSPVLKEHGGALRYNPATFMYSFREPRHYLAAKKLLEERHTD